MNLTSVKYWDSCIYIGLNGSQNERESEAFLERIRSVYVVYKVKAFGRQVRETVLIGKKDLIAKEKEIILKFELNQLHRPEESQFEIGTLKVNFREDKSEVIPINETYSFLEIRAIAPVDLGEKGLVKNDNKALEKKTFYVVEERHFKRLKDSKPSDPSTSSKPSRNGKRLKPTKSSKPDTDKLRELTVIEEATPISAVVSEVESEVESKLDLETMKLDKDIRQLCYGTIDLLLSSLPLPEFSNEHSASNAMVRSIHRYINVDLLRQKESEEEGVESA